MKLTAFALALMFTTAAFAGEVVKKGAPLSDSKPIPVAQVIENPKDYTEKPVVVEGFVSAVCAEMGCWMQLGTEGSKEAAIRVKFKNHAFFIPTDTKGVKARAEGIAKITVLSKEDADHLASEGAKLKRNPDGTVNEVSFEATGVELEK